MPIITADATQTSSSHFGTAIPRYVEVHCWHALTGMSRNCVTCCDYMQDRPLFPGTGYMEIALAATMLAQGGSSQTSQQSAAAVVEGMIVAPLQIQEPSSARQAPAESLRCTVTWGVRASKILLSSIAANFPPTTHLVTSLAVAASASGQPDQLPYLPDGMESILSGGSIAKALRQSAALTDVENFDSLGGYVVPPAVMDASLQLSAVVRGTETGSIIPVGFGSASSSLRATGTPLVASVNNTSSSPSTVPSRGSKEDIISKHRLRRATDGASLASLQQMRTRILPDGFGASRAPAVSHSLAGPSEHPCNLLAIAWNAHSWATERAPADDRKEHTFKLNSTKPSATIASLLQIAVSQGRRHLRLSSVGIHTSPQTSPLTGDFRVCPVPGMLRTAAMEVRGFLSSHLDTDPLTSKAPTRPSMRVSFLAQHLQPSADAVRAGVRLTQALAPSSTPARPAAHLKHGPSGLHTLVTGGTGILGSLVAGWLRRIGDRHQQLLGRSGKVSPAMLDALCLPGPQPHLLSVTLCDVSASEEVLSLVRQRDGSQLQGVMHAGGVLSDATIHKQTVQRFRQVFAPKVCGMCQPRASWSSAAVQHQVLFSSIAALYGSPGQLNYSGANSVLDAMAHAQRMMGVGVVSIQWGAWGGSGMAMRDSGTARRMGRMGIGMLGAVDGLRALGGILGTDRGPCLAVTPMVWERFIKQEFGFPAGFLKEFETDSALQTPADSQVLPADSPAPASKFEMPTALPDHTLVASASTATAVREAVEEAVSGILGTSVGATDPLAAAGLDSLGAVELRNSMEERLGLALPATLLFDYPTVEDLVAHLGAALPSARAETSSGAPPPSQPGAVGAEEVQQQVVEAVSAILGSGVDMTQPLVAAGVDSLGAVELRNNLEERLGCQLPATLLFDFPTVTDLSAHLHKTMADRQANKVKSDLPSILRQPALPEEGLPGSTVAIASLQSTAGRLPYNVIQKACAQDMVGVVPRGRWDVDGHNARREAASTGNRFAVWLDGVAHFDGAAFQVPDAEAVLMDPQQRLLLETGWEALEGACDPVGSSCGVYVGIWHADYHEMIQDAASMMGGSYVAYHATGTNASVSAGRLSYTFGLKGPSMSLDTACSASLVAMHLALKGLRDSEVAASLVCGVSLLLESTLIDVLVSAQMLSACGRCQTLDAAADGYGRGEACIAFLASLWGGTPGQGAALVRGTAVNQDGRSSSLTAPNGPAQQAVAQSAWDAAGAPVADMRALQASLPSPHTIQPYPHTCYACLPVSIPCTGLPARRLPCQQVTQQLCGL